MSSSVGQLIGTILLLTCIVAPAVCAAQIQRIIYKPVPIRHEDSDKRSVDPSFLIWRRDSGDLDKRGRPLDMLNSGMWKRGRSFDMLNSGIYKRGPPLDMLNSGVWKRGRSFDMLNSGIYKRGRNLDMLNSGVWKRGRSFDMLNSGIYKRGRTLDMLNSGVWKFEKAAFVHHDNEK